MHQALPPPPSTPMGWVPYMPPNMRSSPSPLWCGGGVVLSPSPPVVWWGYGMMCMGRYDVYGHVWKVWYVWYVW